MTEKSDTLEKFSMTKFQNARQKDASFGILNYLLIESLLFGRFTPAGKWRTNYSILENGRQVFLSDRCQNVRQKVQVMSGLDYS